jgi:hypothetical protein
MKNIVLFIMLGLLACDDDDNNDARSCIDASKIEDVLACPQDQVLLRGQKALALDLLFSSGQYGLLLGYIDMPYTLQLLDTIGHRHNNGLGVKQLFVLALLVVCI